MESHSKEVDITTMKKFKNVLGSLMDLTNALSGESNLGISSVLSLLCKAESVLEASDSDSHLSSCILDCVRCELRSQ